MARLRYVVRVWGHPTIGDSVQGLFSSKAPALRHAERMAAQWRDAAKVTVETWNPAATVSGTARARRPLATFDNPSGMKAGAWPYEIVRESPDEFEGRPHSVGRTFSRVAAAQRERKRLQKADPGARYYVRRVMHGGDGTVPRHRLAMGNEASDTFRDTSSEKNPRRGGAGSMLGMEYALRIGSEVIARFLYLGDATDAALEFSRNSAHDTVELLAKRARGWQVIGRYFKGALEQLPDAPIERATNPPARRVPGKGHGYSFTEKQGRMLRFERQKVPAFPHYRTLKKKGGVSLTIGYGAGGPSKVVAVLFDPALWSESRARSWIERNESRLGQMIRTNPPHVPKGAKLIYPHCEEIRAVKPGGQGYKHAFETRPPIYGLENGSLYIPAREAPLWGVQ